MPNLDPYVYLRDLSDPSFPIIASTHQVLDWSFSWELDKPGALMVEVAAGEPGNATLDGALSFADALLQAAAPLAGGAPKPILIAFSLDGGAAVDARKLARGPVRTLSVGRRAIKEEGPDLASDALTLAVVERATYTDMALSDVLTATAGTIVPLDTLGIAQPGNPVPYLCGLLQVAPDFPATWSAGAKQRLRFTGYCNPAISSTPTNVDADSVTVLSLLDTLCNRMAGSVNYASGLTDQQFGHYVADCSDASLNLVSSTSFSPAPTAPPTTAPNTVIIGHVGTANHLTFNAAPTGPAAETDTVALVHQDQSMIHSDDGTIYQQANFVGGRANLGGLPDGSTISGFALLNYQAIPTALLPGPAAGYMSPSGTAWTDGLLCLGVAFNADTGGGAYFLDPSQSTVRPIPGSPNRPCRALGYDNGGGVRSPGLLLGTNYGVFYCATLAALPAATSWTRLGTMKEDVVRLAIESDPVNQTYPVVYAHTQNTGSSEKGDSLWRWAFDGTSWTWKEVLTGRIIDFCSTDYQTIFVSMEQPENQVTRWHVTAAGEVQTPGGGPAPDTYSVPSGTVIRRLDRVSTSNAADDSVWMLCDGGTSPAYYLQNVAGTWTLKNANADGTIKGPAPDYAPVGVHRAVGLGVTVDPQLTGGGTAVRVMLGTSQGALWTDQALGSATPNWRRVDQGGLANFAVRGLIAPEAIHKLGTDDAHKYNPIYFLADDDILVSNSSGRWVFALKGRDRTLAGVHLSNITLALTGDLPSGLVQTWGTKNSDGTDMTASPLGLAASTHVHIPTTSPDALPAGLYIERYVDLHGDWQYKMVAQNCHVPGINLAQLPELQTRATVLADEASRSVITVATRFLQQHAQSQTVLTLESDFSTTTHALRTLRPTHKVAIAGTLSIRDLSPSGALLTSTPYTFSGTEAFYVLRHEIKRGPGGNTATTTTTLGSRLLNNFVTAQDIAASQADALHSAIVWR